MKYIQKPPLCRKEKCGSPCSLNQVEMVASLYGRDPLKCPYYVRDELRYDKKKINDIKREAYEEIEEVIDDSPPDIILEKIKQIISH